MTEIIAGEKYINEKLLNCFKYQDSLFLAKDLIKATQAQNEHLVNNVNDTLINLRNAINKKEILENENPTKVGKLLSPSDRIDLKRSYKYVTSSKLSIYYAWKNVKKSYKNKKFEISVPT